ncbi:MAG: N-6 DNA methylase [Acidimicrobiaceae bacterium]|nr:N-6 DNA methylase [Acidimicrobiaceae bacterium]MYJ81143.1 N-6 DNA methylase [Acidimicrobiaceae bacterium]MYK73642.1 N-6 DNA methylase [Acidimicrobiaceae bacterium]
MSSPPTANSEVVGLTAAESAADRMLSHHQMAVNQPAETRSSEADISGAVVDLLVEAKLASRESVRREADRNDIRTEDLIIEVKRRTAGSGANPDPTHLAQLEEYLRRPGAEARIGVLTDGRHWFVRLPAEPAEQITPASTFVMRDANGVHDWIEWLTSRTQALPTPHRAPTPDALVAAFGASARARGHMAALQAIYDANRGSPTVAVKRELWQTLLAVALGEAVNAEAGLDELFVRHTYLSTVVALAVQAAFGVSLEDHAARNPGHLLDGSVFVDAVGVAGVVESDFFGWPVEFDSGTDEVASLARWVARFDWAAADYDIARVLYQSVIGAAERKRLGEYYTPDWLAEAVVEEVVDEPLLQRVLDPACGSGTFLRAATVRYTTAARSAGMTLEDTLTGLQRSVIGVDIHPVAVHLARATWVLAARDVIGSASNVSELAVPVYLGDSMQLRSDAGTLLGDAPDIHVEVLPEHSGAGTLQLAFPKSLIAERGRFDRLMIRAATDVAAGLDPTAALEEFDVAAGRDRDVLAQTLNTLKELHASNRNHVWAYYTRNLVRPWWLTTGEGRVDRIVGNPPWLTYSQAEASVRDSLRQLSAGLYEIWAGGQYAPHQDLAALFYARCFDLYLAEDGRSAMVMPHSALGQDQYRKWRSGRWGSVLADLSEPPWDLERIEPNDFFPVPGSVVFARRGGGDRRLPDQAVLWEGPAGGPNTRTPGAGAARSSDKSPYADLAKQGATLVPRRFFFVKAWPSKISLARGVYQVSTVRSPKEKQPWKDLDVPDLEVVGSVEGEHVFEVHRGDTIAPFVAMEPCQAVLPVKAGAASMPRKADGSFDYLRVGERVRRRWRTIEQFWEQNRSGHNKLSLLDQIDFLGKLESQLQVHDARLLYATSGHPTAAALVGSPAIVDSSLYRIDCSGLAEACFLVAVINSQTLAHAVRPYMPKGQFGARHLHKHLWQLPVPAYDPKLALHRELAVAGHQATYQATERLRRFERQRRAEGRTVTNAAARAELRAWLDASAIGHRIEALVGRLGI